ncbi:hypothetical protein MKW92_022825 [Papaver armeniacum]|nr:hypothetical protein MKW92_022825 [Papaver armeniacum]
MKPTATSSCLVSKQKTPMCKFKPLVIPPPVDGGGVGVVIPLNENRKVHAIMVETLLRYVILQSEYNNKYLRSVKGNSQVPLALKFGGEYSFDLDTRFELEKGEDKDAVGLFNIRCMYNNKYLATVGEFNNWITAVAAQPVEDQTKWSCTLFQPVFVTTGDNTILRFRHMATGNFASLRTNVSTLFLVINWESVVMFPNRIALKGDNGNYLVTGTDASLGFSIARLRGTDTEFEVTPSRNGGIRIKSISNNTFWSGKNSSWVLADGFDETIHKTENVFLPVKYAENMVAFRCLKDNLYCKRLTAYDKKDCLGRVNKYIDESSLLIIEDPVVSRKSRTSFSASWMQRCLEENPSCLSTERSPITPNGHDGRNGSQVFRYSSYEWGQTVEREVQMGSVYTFEVPSKSVLKASMIGTQGTAGIPFSYTQTDNLSDGTTVVYRKDDGWYVSANSFIESFRIDRSAIPTAKL